VAAGLWDRTNLWSGVRRCAGLKTVSVTSSGCSGARRWRSRSLKEALAKSESKKTELAPLVAAEGRYPMKVVAETLGVARSHLRDKVKQDRKPRESYRKADDDALLPRSAAWSMSADLWLTGASPPWPTELATAGNPPVNPKRSFG
jgi:hypothetical protein